MRRPAPSPPSRAAPGARLPADLRAPDRMGRPARSCRPAAAATASFGQLQPRDTHPFEPENLAVEGDFRLERGDDRLGTAESVLLTGKPHVRGRDPAAS